MIKYAIIPLLLVAFSATAYADVSVFTDGKYIGKELMVKTHTFEHKHYKVSKTTEDVTVTILTGYSQFVEQKSCTTNERNGYCALAFKLTDGKYNTGWYIVQVEAESGTFEKRIWLQERTY